MKRDGRAHAPLDPVSIMRLAHHLAHREADAWSAGSLWSNLVRVQPSRGHGIAPRAEEDHLARVLLAAGVVGTLIIRMLAQAQVGETSARVAELFRRRHAYDAVA